MRKERETISGKKDKENTVTQKMFRAVLTEDRSSSPMGDGFFTFRGWKSRQECGIVIKS